MSEKSPSTTGDAEDVLRFWFEETRPAQWWRRDAAFDRDIGRRFGGLHRLASAGGLGEWSKAPRTALALVILLDQFSRNLHRDAPEAFADDAGARAVADAAIARGFDLKVPEKERAFFYMPFMHSEALADQDRAVALFAERLPGSDNIRHAEQHRDVIRRFGRFPHRNAALGRESTAEESKFLAEGGFSA